MRCHSAIVTACLAVAVSAVAAEQAQTQDRAQGAQGQTQMDQAMPAGGRQAAMQRPDGVVTQREDAVVFKVTKVDPQTRTLTLQGPQGSTMEYKVGPRVQRFEKIKPGDQIQAATFTRIGLFRQAPGAAPQQPEEDVVAMATPGDKPGMVVARVDQVTVKVDDVDPQEGTITLKGPRGNSVEIPVADKQIASQLKKGDEVTIRFTEALAIRDTGPEARPAGGMQPGQDTQPNP